MIAVLTGDIVNSTSLSKQDYIKVMKGLDTYIITLQQRFDCYGEVYRGDSYQLAFNKPANIMHAAILLDLYMAKEFNIALTQSVAVGMVEHIGDSVGSSQGEAFVLSGRNLELTSKGTTSLSFSKKINDSALVLATDFLNHLLHANTRKQTEVLYHFIDMNYPEQQQIADILSITRQNVAMHLKRSGAVLVKKYITTFCKSVEFHSGKIADAE